MGRYRAHGEGLRVAVTTLALLLAQGCSSSLDGYSCGPDATCSGSNICLDRACAAVDSSCASGWRWDDTASGDRAGQCAPTRDSGLDSIPDEGINEGIDAAILDDIAAPTPDLATCGNGVLDPGETCDPSVAGGLAPCPDKADCDDHNGCTNDEVVGATCARRCVHDYVGHDDGTTCSDGNAVGQCQSHQCCTTCRSGSFCLPGRALTACGASGGLCLDCTPRGDDCNLPSCVSGGCKTTPVGDGTPCAPVGGGARGQCVAGVCCTGCVLNGACLAGTDKASCGAAGAACQVCPGSGGGGVPMCSSGKCLGCTGSCGSATCGTDNCGNSCGTCTGNRACQSGACKCLGTVENGDAQCGNGIDDDCNGATDCVDVQCALKSCAPGSFCKSGACVAGCRIGGVYYAPGATSGDPCKVCNPAEDPEAFTAAVDGAACTSGGSAGQCHQGGCCTGCWNDQNDSCVAVAQEVLTRCGRAGATCASCDDGNPCSFDACAAGACQHKAFSDGTVCRPSQCSGGCKGCSGACVQQSLCVSGQCADASICCGGLKCCNHLIGAPTCAGLCIL